MDLTKNNNATPVAPSVPSEPPPENKTFIEEIRNKSFAQIISDQTPAPNASVETPTAPGAGDKEAEEAKIAAEKAKAETEAKAAQQAKDEQTKAEALAKTAAAEALKQAQDQAEIKAKAEAEAKVKAEADKQNKDQSRPKWEWDNDSNRPKDANGKPLPYSYEEVAEEGRRLGKLDAITEFEKRQAEAANQAEAKAKAAEAAKQGEEDSKKAYQAAVDKKINDELNDLYATDKLPKIVDNNDNRKDEKGFFLDPGKRAQQELFNIAFAVNEERIKQGLTPIDSVKLIYYEHYKQQQQSLGADAPVMGNSRPASATQDSEYDWAKDHHKTPRQILAEARAKLSRKL